jgi:ClpA/ClpB-like protein
MTTSGVEGAAFKEAERLGHDFVGPEHGVLAVLRGDPTDLARLALEDVGITADSVERLLRQMIGADPRAVPERAPGISPNPAWYRVIGRAEGFAASVGTGDVRPLDLVLALLWSRRPLLDQPPTSRQALVEALAQRGAGLPPTPLPELPRQTLFTQNVEFPRRYLVRVLDLLHESHPAGVGPTYAFNHDGAERAWVNAEDGFELQAIVDSAVAEDSA